MVNNSGSGCSPIAKEGAYSGKIFLLGAPRTGVLDHVWLQEVLENASVKIESAVNLEDTDLHIPEIFQTDSGKTADIASINEVSEFETAAVSGVVGLIKHNDPDTITFEEDRVLILKSCETQFAIFQTQGQYYLSILGRRELAESISEIISEELKRIGFTIEDLHIDDRGFENIAEKLVDYLRLTTIADYSNPNIDKKRYIGKGYDNEEEFMRDLQNGSIHGHRFGTQKIGDGTDKTVEVSEDGLVRSYNTISLGEYLNMIATYIVPNVRKQTQTSVHAYSKGSIASTGQNLDD